MPWHNFCETFYAFLGSRVWCWLDTNTWLSLFWNSLPTILLNIKLFWWLANWVFVSFFIVFYLKLCQKCLFGNLWNKGSCCFWNVSSTDWWWASNYSDWQPTSHSNVKMGRSFYSRAIQLFPEGFHECENFEKFQEIHVVCSLIVFREYFFCTITDGSPRWTLTDNENKQPDSKLLSTVYLKLFLWWWNSLWNINCFLPIWSKRLKYICFLGI